MYQVSVPRGRCEGSITSVKTNFQWPYGCTSVLIAAQRATSLLERSKGPPEFVVRPEAAQKRILQNPSMATFPGLATRATARLDREKEA